MKIAIMGCGAMGSVYAGLLAANGHEVIAVDRWAEHVQAMSEQGLRVEGASGDRVARLRAYREAPAEPVDLIIIAVKAAQAGSAAAQARAMLGPDTLVLTIQNGLGSADSVAEAIGAERLAVGIAAAFGASLSGPGHVHHNGMSAVRMGAYAGLGAEAGWHRRSVARRGLQRAGGRQPAGHAMGKADLQRRLQRAVHADRPDHRRSAGCSACQRGQPGRRHRSLERRARAGRAGRRGRPGCACARIRRTHPRRQAVGHAGPRTAARQRNRLHQRRHPQAGGPRRHQAPVSQTLTALVKQREEAWK